MLHILIDLHYNIHYQKLYLDIDPTQCHPNYTADIREGVAVEYVSCEPTETLKELFPEQYGEGDDSFEEEETEQA